MSGSPLLSLEVYDRSFTSTKGRRPISMLALMTRCPKSVPTLRMSLRRDSAFSPYIATDPSLVWSEAVG